MPAHTLPILELRPDGDVLAVKIKQSAAKPTLKDIQSYLKKRTAPSILTSYPYGNRKLTLIGYTKGKEEELSQHELPPPFESEGIYGSIAVVVHSSELDWDAGSPVVFTTAEYEAFYEKACNGELVEKADDADVDADVEEDIEETEDAEEEATEEDGAGDDEEEDIDNEVGDEEEDIVAPADEEEEEVVRPVRARRAPKVDPQQLQFQYVNDLVPQEEVAENVITGPREKVVNALVHVMGTECSRDDILALELGIFNAAIAESIHRKVPQSWQTEQFHWIYRMIATRVASNFAPNSYVKNARLLQRWKDGEFPLETLGTWSHFDLNPDNWNDLKDQQFRREKRILEGNTAMATDRFRCSRCQKKMCTYYELQTRSADEPMTIFITCVNCGKQWRQ